MRLVFGSSLAFRVTSLMLVMLVWLVYWPGLGGPFLFDDHPNLSRIGDLGGVTDWHSFVSFVFGGFAGPTGRPVSLLTFLLNSTSWPADPFGFKVTNVVIHLINGWLIFLISQKLLLINYRATASFGTAQLRWFALFCAAAWLLHPYLTSTTLYVVQRMAMLSALFCFLGLYLYILGRLRFPEKPSSGALVMLLGIGAGTLLAVFSKENGAVLPLLILVFEGTIGTRQLLNSRYHTHGKTLLLVIPSILLFVYLASHALRNGFFVDYRVRDYSPYERLLTQGRVVISYLESWFVPSFSGGQLFYDNLETSKGWFTPWTTLFSAALVLISIVLSLVYRKRYPLWSFAVLFYLASQVIESTTVGLELKFDHRAYLGSAFLSLPLIVVISRHLAPGIRKLVAGVILLVLSAAAYSASSLWGDYEKLTLVWAAQNPMSVRSQTEAAQVQFNAGRKDVALEILDEAALLNPDDFRLRLTQALLQCRQGTSPRAAIASVSEAASRGPYKHTDFGLLESFFSGATDDECVGISLEDFNLVVDTLIDSMPEIGPESQIFSQLHYYRGLGLLRTGELQEARESLEKSLQSRPSLHMRMTVAANKANVGLYSEALEEAKYVRSRLASGEVTGRDLAEAPRMEDVEHFIRVVEQDIIGAGQ